MPTETMGYAEALAIVQELAIENLADPRDTAGDDSLEAARVRQDTALETVQAYLDAGGASSLPAVGDPSPEAGPVAVRPDADPSELADAVRIVLDLGRANVLADDGPDMEDEVARQERAVALVGSLVTDHGVELAVRTGHGPA